MVTSVCIFVNLWFMALQVNTLFCPPENSKNVVLLSIGLYADVIFVWETICWANYASHFTIEGGIAQPAI